jgi:hypothetical protein
MALIVWKEIKYIFVTGTYPSGLPKNINWPKMVLYIWNYGKIGIQMAKVLVSKTYWR